MTKQRLDHGDTLDASDLIDDDGNVDGRKFATSHTPDTRVTVRPEECDYWRRELDSGTPATALVDVLSNRRTYSTIHYHATGGCKCDNNVSPVEHTTGGGGNGGEWRRC